jgi:uncharacterized membrane protein
MLDLIFAIKFVHVLAAAAMLGTWLGVALFMLLAHRSGNTSVVAVTSRFAVSVEKIVMIAAFALLPISGFPLAWSVGVSQADQFWIGLSLVLYVVVVAAWLAALRIEIRIRNMTQQAVLDGELLKDAYRRLFRLYTALVWPILAGMVILVLLMVWQPRLS